jgi:general secretion pathway protein F
MTVFRYDAFGPSGEPVAGTIEADCLPAALAILRQKGLSAYRAEPAPGGADRRIRGIAVERLGLAWRARVVRQLATLLAAGIGLDGALRILSTQAKRAEERRVIDAILDGVSAGRTLSGAMSRASRQFTVDEVGLIKAGEHGGSLVPVLEELSTLLERRLELRGKLVSALVYPAFLLLLAPLSLIVIATVLVPNLAPLFADSRVEPPLALSAMIWTSTQLGDHGWSWLPALLVLGVLASYLSRRGAGQVFIDRVTGRIPILRVVRRRAQVSRICRTLGSLLRSGSSLQAALAALLAAASGRETVAGLTAAREAVSGGAKLADALKQVAVIDPQALQMIAIGEETNRLDSMLHCVADGEEKALAAYVDRIMALLTPVLTIAMGLLVGGIVMSVMGAILSVTDLAVR